MTEVRAPVRYRSYSQLSMYQQCPESYRLKYIERMREEPSVWSVGGTAFHSVAEWFMRGDLGADPTSNVIVDAWRRAWQLAYEEVLRRDPTVNPNMRTWRAASRGKETHTWWQVNGLLMVQEFVAWRKSAGASLVVLSDGERKFLEAELMVQLGGVTVKAIPDALVVDEHGQLNIMDYKTGKPPRESKQLGVYKAAVLEALGMEATWGLYYMARDTRLLPVDLARYSPAAIGEDFARLDLGVLSGVFDPTPGDHCKFCSYKPKCRYYNPESA